MFFWASSSSFFLNKMIYFPLYYFYYGKCNLTSKRCMFLKQNRTRVQLPRSSLRLGAVICQTQLRKNWYYSSNDFLFTF